MQPSSAKDYQFTRSRHMAKTRFVVTLPPPEKGTPSHPAVQTERLGAKGSFSGTLQPQIIKLSAILHRGTLGKDPSRPAVQTERVGARGTFSRTPNINLFALLAMQGTPPGPLLSGRSDRTCGRGGWVPGGLLPSGRSGAFGCYYLNPEHLGFAT